jgi:hypothetical protein
MKPATARRLQTAGALACVVFATGCVAPAWNGSAYRDDASKAVGSGLSEAMTAHLMIGQFLRDRTTSEFADVVITNDESAMGPIQDSFGSVQPPTPSDDSLRDEVLQLLGDEQVALAQARIAVRRSDSSSLATADKTLVGLIAQLNAAQKKLR